LASDADFTLASRCGALIPFSRAQEIRPMMGERRVMQEALFYDFSFERHILLRVHGLSFSEPWEPPGADQDFVVELRGFEPVISAMRHPRALTGCPPFRRQWRFCAVAPIGEPALSTERLEVGRQDIVLPHMIQGLNG
jgi:hypothetical protein